MIRVRDCRIKDENGEYIWQETYKETLRPYVELSDLEELIKLRQAVNNELIITDNEWGDNVIEIYDHYRE